VEGIGNEYTVEWMKAAERGMEPERVSLKAEACEAGRGCKGKSKGGSKGKREGRAKAKVVETVDNGHQAPCAS
jgi:hypothetical protein